MKSNKNQIYKLIKKCRFFFNFQKKKSYKKSDDFITKISIYEYFFLHNRMALFDEGGLNHTHFTGKCSIMQLSAINGFN